MVNSIILIVDDTPDNIFLLEVILEKEGFSTLSAENGLEAIEVVKNNKVDLILMDVMMPEMDGFEASRNIRDMKASEHIPIIMITAKKREQGDVIRGLGEGAVDYLTKPFDDGEIVARVKSMLRIKHLHDANIELLEQIRKQQKHMETELKMAESIQKYFLPSSEHLGSFKNCKIEANYQATIRIGGDIYDIFEYGENKVFFTIADITGHGPSAALIMGLLKALLESESADYPNLTTLAWRLNKKLLDMTPDTHFVTAFLGVADFEKSELTYVTAGHPPPYLVGKTSTSKRGRLKSTGSLLGIFNDGDAFFEEKTVSFSSADKLIFFSDGVYESIGKDDKIYGLLRLEKRIDEKVSVSAKEILKHIWSDVENFRDDNAEQDDIAVVVVEFL